MQQAHVLRTPFPSEALRLETSPAPSPHASQAVRGSLINRVAGREVIGVSGMRTRREVGKMRHHQSASVIQGHIHAKAARKRAETAKYEAARADARAAAANTAPPSPAVQRVQALMSGRKVRRNVTEAMRSGEKIQAIVRGKNIKRQVLEDTLHMELAAVFRLQAAVRGHMVRAGLLGIHETESGPSSLYTTPEWATREGVFDSLGSLGVWPMTGGEPIEYSTLNTGQMGFPGLERHEGETRRIEEEASAQREVSDTFDKYDLDGDGLLSRSDLASLIRQLFKVETTATLTLSSSLASILPPSP